MKPFGTRDKQEPVEPTISTPYSPNGDRSSGLPAPWGHAATEGHLESVQAEFDTLNRRARRKVKRLARAAIRAGIAKTALKDAKYALTVSSAHAANTAPAHRPLGRVTTLGMYVWLFAADIITLHALWESNGLTEQDAWTLPVALTTAQLAGLGFLVKNWLDTYERPERHRKGAGDEPGTDDDRAQPSDEPLLGAKRRLSGILAKLAALGGFTLVSGLTLQGSGLSGGSLAPLSLLAIAGDLTIAGLVLLQFVVSAALASYQHRPGVTTYRGANREARANRLRLVLLSLPLGRMAGAAEGLSAELKVLAARGAARSRMGLIDGWRRVMRAAGAHSTPYAEELVTSLGTPVTAAQSDGFQVLRDLADTSAEDDAPDRGDE
jgi:hypothetical protein